MYFFCFFYRFYKPVKMAETNNNKDSLKEFYKGKSILVTGASGFMGKVLIEKLLYSCSDLKQIFILVRPKRGKSVDQRLDEMFKLPVSLQKKKKKKNCPKGAEKVKIGRPIPI